MPYDPSSLLFLQAWVLLAAWLTALLEIQIEGAYGWAARLPTWRYGPPWLKRLMGGKDITGYHVYLVLLQLCFVHFPVFFTEWSPLFEVTVLGCYFCYAIAWDFLWFMLNPAFGLGRFSARNVWWFSRWIGPLPADYFLYLTLSGLLATSRGLFGDAGTETWLGDLSKPLQHLVMWLGAIAGTAGVFGLMALVVSKLPSKASAAAAPVPPAAPTSAPASNGAVAPVVAPEDPLVEEVAEAERLQRAQWLIQFGELMFGIVVGLSISRVADTRLFSPESTRSLGDVIGLAWPLLLLYCWMVFYLIIYWYNMRLETPVFAVFIRQSSGVMHLVLIVVLGFIMFQALDVVTPNFSTLEESHVLPRVDTVMRWLGFLIVFDLLGQTYLRALWLKSCDQLERANVSWKALVPGIRRYYGLEFPAKTVGLFVVYMLLFFPGASFLPDDLRYPLPSHVGLDSPTFIAFGFVFTNLACEAYLGLRRRSVHRVVQAYRLDARRRHRVAPLDAAGEGHGLISNEEAEMLVERGAGPARTE